MHIPQEYSRIFFVHTTKINIDKDNQLPTEDKYKL